jgi:hypothetical protein
MVDVLANKAGIPLIGYGKRSIIHTTGAPALASGSKPEMPKQEPNETMTINGGQKIVDWGDGNRFPTEAELIIGKTGVLNTGLKFIRNFTLGQGIYPVTVEGYNDDGNEILKVYDDAKVRNFLKSRIVRRYMEEATRDFFKFGMAFPQLLPNADGLKIVGINNINALRCRLTEQDKNGNLKCVVSGDFPESPKADNYRVYDVLEEYDPADHLDRLRIGGKVAGKSFIYPLRDSWSNNDYYPLPIWWSAKLAGWIDIAASVPKFLKKAYENQITWMWHVQIPYAYWDKKYPVEKYPKEEDRAAAIVAEMDTIEDTLTGEDNAHKTLFTMFEVGNNGKAEEQWLVTRLDNKTADADKLFTSAAANSEILFALSINPNVMGAGMPGGTYSGNQGGSNIREAYLVNIANAWLDQQNILDPIELLLQYNGVKDVELRFRKTILTTLDTGAGTKKVVS